MPASVQEVLELARHQGSNFVHRTYDFETTLDTTNVWSVVKDASASVAIASDTQHGAVVLSSAATTNDDGALLQSIQEHFKLESGKRFAIRARIKNSDADQHDFFFGIAQKAATNPENCLTVSNRVGFQINDEDASILCKSELSDLETSVDSQLDQADDTYRVFGISYDGSGRIQYEIDGTAVAVISTNIPTTELAIALFNLSGNNTGTHTCTCDYIEVAAER